MEKEQNIGKPNEEGQTEKRAFSFEEEHQRRRQRRREAIESIPTPTDPINAFALLLSVDIEAVDDERVTPEEFRTRWEGMREVIDGASSEEE